MRNWLIASALCLALNGFAADRPAERQRNQQQRIYQGARSGELTRHEVRKLESKEARLHREIRHDRVDGGGLTPKERVKIEKKQDRLSHQIARQKHDHQER